MYSVIGALQETFLLSRVQKVPYRAPNTLYIQCALLPGFDDNHIDSKRSKLCLFVNHVALGRGEILLDQPEWGRGGGGGGANAHSGELLTLAGYATCLYGCCAGCLCSLAQALAGHTVLTEMQHTSLLSTYLRPGHRIPALTDMATKLEVLVKSGTHAAGKKQTVASTH